MLKTIDALGAPALATWPLVADQVYEVIVAGSAPAAQVTVSPIDGFPGRTVERTDDRSPGSAHGDRERLVGRTGGTVARLKRDRVAALAMKVVLKALPLPLPPPLTVQVRTVWSVPSVSEALQSTWSGGAPDSGVQFTEPIVGGLTGAFTVTDVEERNAASSEFNIGAGVGAVAGAECNRIGPRLCIGHTETRSSAIARIAARRRPRTGREVGGAAGDGGATDCRTSLYCGRAAIRRVNSRRDRRDGHGGAAGRTAVSSGAVRGLRSNLTASSTGSSSGRRCRTRS